MAGRTLPGLGLKGDWALGEDLYKDEMDTNLRIISTLLGANVVDRVSATPGAPAEGDRYIFKSDHPAQPNKVAIYDEATWSYVTAPEGLLLYNLADDKRYEFKNGSWTELVTGSSGGGSGGTLPFRGAVVKRASDQLAINAVGAPVLVAWDAEISDTDGFHDNVTNNSRLTIPVGITKVRVSFGLLVNNSTVDTWAVARVNKNGSAVFDGAVQHGTELGIAFPRLSAVSAVLDVVAGDYFTLSIETESDTSIDVKSDLSWFAVEVVEQVAGYVAPTVPPFRGARAKKLANQVGANFLALTAVTWDGEDFDTNAFHSTSANTERMTIPVGVTKVRLSAQVRIDSGTAGEGLWLWLRKNGSSAGMPTSQTGFIGATALGNIQSQVIDVVAGDYFDIQVQVLGADAAVDLNAGASYLSIEVVEGQPTQSNFRGAMVRKAADQAGANYVGGAVVTWDSEDYDTDGYHDNVTNNARLTVPVGVTRAVLYGQLRFANVTASEGILIEIRKNGSATPIAVQRGSVSGSTNPSISLCSPPIPCAAGDYFELFVFMGADASIDITASRSHFAIEAVEHAIPKTTTHRGCLLTRTADLVGADFTTNTSLLWAAEQYDTDGFHDNAVNTSRITIPAGVTKVRLQAMVFVGNLATGSWTILRLYKNGTSAFPGGCQVQDNPGTGSASARLHMNSAIINVAEGDYFYLAMETGADTIVDIPADYSWFACEVIE
jgi:hypothetical protein